MDIKKIRSGDIVLVATESWFGRTIRKVTKAKWSHVAMFLWLWGELFIIESEKNGIQLTKWTDNVYNSGNPKNMQLTYLTPNEKVNEKEIAMLMLPYVGISPYDYMGLFNQFVYQYTGKWIGKKIDGDDKFYCSEFVAFIYNKLNKNNFPNWWEISPGQIFTDIFHEVKY